MADNSEKLADSIRSGAYFGQARAWYQSIYIGPVSERTFFMLIAALAGAVAVMAILALASLMPLTEKVPIILSVQDDIDDYAPRIVGLRDKQGAASDGILRYYVRRYVGARESYSAADWLPSANFVHTQSDTATYDVYLLQRNPKNPESLAAQLGKDGAMDVVIRGIGIDRQGDGGSATVDFVTQVRGSESSTRTRWTARMKYKYTDVVIATVKNEKTGADETEIKDPQFQVTEYAVEKN